MEKLFFSEFPFNIPISYTYNDFLLIPQYTEITSRSQCDVASLFSKNVPLNIPIVSSPMDTVTETKMAIGMARNGGIGVLHRYQSIKDQVKMLLKAKRAENFIIEDPYVIDENETIENVKKIVDSIGISSFLVTDMQNKQVFPGRKNSFMNNSGADLLFKNNTFTKLPSNCEDDKFELKGILTSRDLKAAKSSDAIVKTLMTKREKMTVFTKPNDANLGDTDKVKLYDVITSNRLEKLPIVDQKNFIVGLATEKDLYRILNSSVSNVNDLGKLRVSAAVGCRGDYLERAEALVSAGCDALVIDVANGHNKMTIDVTAELKEKFKGKCDIVSGNVATGDGARRLIEAGADSIRVGIGNGSICITRIVSGAGVPQVTALMSVSKVCNEYNIPIISDGGNKTSGNMCKSLAIGSSCLMLGRLIAGTDESPNKPFLKNGTYVKIHRGMAGYGANLAKAEKMNTKQPDGLEFTPEGVEGYVNYSGSLANVLKGFVMGIKSGMSYTGARTIRELREKGVLTLISQSGLKESHSHGITQMK